MILSAGFAAAVAAVASLDGESAEKLALACRGGEARYAIVLPDSPSPSQSTAAAELQAHVEKMTGVCLPVATNTIPERGIFLGNGAPELGNDGFRIVVRPPHLYIEGGRVHGTLFGVYDFLERHCGCEWLSSTTSVIPRRERLEIPATLDETRLPAFRFRDANWWEQQHDFAFAARMKMNGFRTEYPESFGGMDLKMDCTTGQATFDSLVPPKKHFKDHPEWFAFVDGRRRCEKSQLCLTNPEVVEFLASNVLARIARRYPAAKYYGINQNDWRNFCECPRCKALAEREGSQMGPILAMVNAVAERVEKRYPDVVIHTLAYMYSHKPPKTIRSRDNVMVIHCTDQCDFSKPLAKSRWRGSKAFVEDFAGWSEICRNLYIWDYSANFQYLPMAFECVHVMPENFRLFKNGGAVGVFEEGHHVGSRGADAQLKLWVLAHLEWDPFQPLEPLLRRFFSGYYGDAADTARAYYDALVAAELARDEGKMPLLMWGRLEDEALPVAFFDKWSAEWEKALERVKGDPVRTDNVRWALNQVDWVRILLANSATNIVLSRNPENVLRRIAALKPAALRIEADLAKEPTARKVSGLTKESNARLRAVAHFNPSAIVAADRVMVEDALLEASEPFGATRVKDPKADDGSAIRIDPSAKGWYQSVLIRSRDMLVDPGVPLKVRVRIRVEKTGKPGEAFTSGTCDNIAYQKRQIENFAVQAADIPDSEYHWYDIDGVWTPEPGEVFWIGMGRYDKARLGHNPAVDGVFVDKMEIRRSERRSASRRSSTDAKCTRTDQSSKGAWWRRSGSRYTRRKATTISR